MPTNATLIKQNKQLKLEIQELKDNKPVNHNELKALVIELMITNLSLELEHTYMCSGTKLTLKVNEEYVDSVDIPTE